MAYRELVEIQMVGWSVVRLLKTVETSFIMEEEEVQAMPIWYEREVSLGEARTDI